MFLGSEAMKKKSYFLVIFFLLLQPFLDLFTGMGDFFIHTLFRGIFLVCCLLYLIRNKKSLPLVFLLTIMMMIYFISYLIFYRYSFLFSLSYTFKLFYLPISILFFYHYEKEIDAKYVGMVLFLYIGLFLFCYFFGLGNEVYETGVKKIGFKGLFNSINELSAIMIVLLPLTLNYLQNKGKYFLCMILALLVSVVSMLTGTKVILGGIIITFLYFLYEPFTNFFKRKNLVGKSLVILSMFLFTGTLCFLFINTTAYKNAIVQKEFFKVDTIFSLEGINKVVFNDRFSFISGNQKNYEKSPFYQKLLGVKYQENTKDVEIDLFDVFYKYGLVGLIFIFSILIYYGYKSRLRSVYLFSYILLFLISESSGHVLLCPAVCLYFGVIIYFNKKGVAK